MKILMVTPFFAPITGGEERLVEDLSVELIARGHEVAVATTTAPPPTRPEDGLRIHQIASIARRLRTLHADRTRRHPTPTPDPEAVVSLRRILAAERPDVVHAHNVPVGRSLAAETVAPQSGVARPHGELMQIFRGSLAVVVPSVWSEPFGLVALEAMAAERPVIASGVGGLMDLVEDGKSGILVPPRDAGALAAAIASLIASPARRDTLGRGARERAQAFRASAVVPRVEAVYRRLLDAADRVGADASHASAAGA